jgi:hypothetical protein
VVLDVVLVGGGNPVLNTRIVGSDLRNVRSMLFTPTRTGTYGIEVRAVDALGCTGSSAGQIRNVVVR